MWCSRIDPDANLVYVDIRGIYGSTAAAHGTGAMVRNQPKFPRVAIIRAINETIRSCYPDLFAVASTEFAYNPSVLTYELPAEMDGVISVSYQEIGPSGAWPQVRRYAVDMSSSAVFAAGHSIDILEPLAPGRTVRVVYRRAPAGMTALTDDFAGTTGLSESARECIIYGACARLVGYTEPARINDDSAEARFIDGSPAGQALTAARYFYQMFMQSRSEEARRLLDRYPFRIHFNR